MANNNNSFRNVGLALVFAGVISLTSGILLGDCAAGIVKDMDKEIVSICDESSSFSLSYAEHLHTLNTRLENKQITKQEYDKNLKYYNSIEYKRSVVYNLQDADTSKLDKLYYKLDIMKSARSTALTLGLVASAGAGLALKKFVKVETEKQKNNQKINDLENFSKNLDEVESTLN